MKIKDFLKTEKGQKWLDSLDNIKTESDIEKYLQILKENKNVNYDEDEVRFSLYLVKDNNMGKLY